MMFVLIRTSGGKKYARRIGQELKRINPRNNWLIPTVGYFQESFRQRPHLNPSNTLIHSRAAYPDGPTWMRNLVAMEEQGFRVVNNTEVLRLTSNKLRCAQKMYGAGLPHPKTWETNRQGVDAFGIWHRLVCAEVHPSAPIPKAIVKPYTSMGQGTYVKVITLHNPEIIKEACWNSPTSKVIVQEFVPNVAIYRVVVIGGEAIPISWRDEVTRDRWKVSVCLNRNMEFIPNPDSELLRIAERTQEVIGGEINFIDVFETQQGYVLSEINTACSLLIHERKAREARSTHWNIAGYIAEYLTEQSRRV